MGYELKLLIGRASANVSPEWALTDKRYSDDSGFEPKRDEKGNIVYTGRKSHWFQDMATVDLCKIGSGPLADLVANAAKAAKEAVKTDYHYFFADDGNTEITEDRYGDGFWPTSVSEVLAAVRGMEDAKTYRRFIWAIPLLKAMDSGHDKGKLSVLFFGH